MTVPLQCRVSNGELVVCERIKSELEGVFDPAEDLAECEKGLHVVYESGGVRGERVVAGDAMLVLP